ncbi:isocitrate lyase/phosphoenolpyruvate mutase family protein [Streptomyces sp. LHD-70]|uniref:isocitrate lyase/PEP mutase family protein n=1 Tax=Streptomyces sp. LHD-70 TaxID=3072140 RepID=UPI00280E63C4|nr:isocitrate lyase/phosphoenolpyruvate mutase family protein [Streptomyces sp. LHD-70]MDQ8707242.1 isocitrate lyase/phosphoenolpyruvate mutase family protein [Streptomyces sp. LHD-70]
MATVDVAALTAKAERLRALHGDRPFVLPNAWDAASAQVLAKAGFPAIATGSKAVADSLGHADLQAAPAEEMLAAAGRIIKAVDVPVTVDMEAGYGMSGKDIVARLLDLGAAGCNVEDTAYPSTDLVDVATQAALIAEMRAAADEAGVPLWINARVDVWEPGAYPKDTPAQEMTDEAVRRGRAYLEAGADSVFPIFVAEEETIAALVERIPGPVNIMYLPQTPSLDRLAELGVARVSFGPGLHMATLMVLEGLAGKIRSGEDPYAEFLARHQAAQEAQQAEQA